MPSEESVTDKVSRSAVALISRQAFGIIVNVVGGIFLARLLTPFEFGIYAIALFAFNFIRVFGDVGLGAGLIRAKEEPTNVVYASIYTIQQVLVAGAVVIFWFLAPWIVAQYELSTSYVWLFRLVALSLIAISFMVIPQLQLERDLAFDKLAVVEVAQVAAFNIVAVWLAFKGFGAFALGWAFLARTVLGAVLINVIHPWHISFKINWKSVKKHLKFGTSFQAVNVIGTINTAVNPILIAMFFGVADAGYVEWAVLLAGYLQRPLILINRLLFPAYSKVREKLQKLTRAVNYTYAASGFLFFALAGILFGLAPQVIQIVYTDKWLPALTLLYLLIISKVFIPLSIPNGSLGYSLGWANTILYLNIAKSILLWVSIVGFIMVTDSILAYGYAMIVTESAHLILYYLLKKELPSLTVVKTQLLFLIAALANTFTIIQVSQHVFINNWLSLILALTGGGIIYIFYCFILYYIYSKLTKDDKIYQAARFLVKNITKKVRSYS